MISLSPRFALVLTLLFAGCTPEPEATPTGPYVLVLGTAQDAGLPQIGCDAPCCRRVRAEPERARMVTSILVADPRSGERWLLDASPDLGRQVELAEGHPATRTSDSPRPPLFEGVFLTHAHMGHYTGLLDLGREAYGAKDLAVFGTERMNGFLRTNGPWSLLVETGGIELRTLSPGEPIRLTSDLSVTALVVPHRDEFSDTVAFLVEGPERKLLYLPDIDRFEVWERSIEDVLAGVDVALLDATFYSADEIPGRSIEDIPHPLVSESIKRFRLLSEGERAKVVFTHLNHSNPIADTQSPEARAVREAGMRVAREGMVFEL